eukprot:scaffold2495_cov101-Isochrysis_galbana.AAC.21
MVMNMYIPLSQRYRLARGPAESRESLVTEGVSLGFTLVESEVVHELNKPKRDEPAACTVALLNDGLTRQNYSPLDENRHPGEN